MNGCGVGITDVLHGFGERPVIVLFALITQLGDVWFLFLLSGGVYIAGEKLPTGGSIGDGDCSYSDSCSPISPSSGF